MQAPLMSDAARTERGPVAMARPSMANRGGPGGQAGPDPRLQQLQADVDGSPRMLAQRRLLAPEGAAAGSSGSSGAPVVQRQWIWNDDRHWWEEDALGYVYDPETGDWRFNDDEDHEDPQAANQVHRQHMLALIRLMNAAEVVEYFDDHDDAPLAIAFASRGLNGNGVTQEEDNEDLFDHEDPLGHFAEMSEGNGLESAVTPAQGGHFVASGGAGPCVIVFLRVRTLHGRVLLGAVHLSADELRTVPHVVGHLRQLHADVTGQIDPQTQDGVQTSTAYAIGGAESNDIDDVTDMVHLRLALTQLAGLMTLGGGDMPASGEDDGYVDAMMDGNSVVYSHQDA